MTPAAGSPRSRFSPTSIAGVMEVAILWNADVRGRFGRTFCSSEFAEHGLSGGVAQCSVSASPRRGTVRGLHLQAPPHEEAKLMQCMAGRAYHVALDLRPRSATYGEHHAVELSEGSGRMLLVPPGCAHGIQTIEDDTRLLYYISTPYAPDSVLGVRWNDPALGVRWPLVDEVIVSERDAALPLLADFAWPA
jgi:dTDP-4-dehydrorhamnose 3,5-epimerase